VNRTIPKINRIEWFRPAIGFGTVLTLIALSPAGATWADTPPTLGDTVKAREAEVQTAPEAGSPAETTDSEAARLAEQWGIEVTSIRLTANDHMIDFRYRVLDAAKAKELFVRQNKPRLIHQETGKVLAVPETAKVGPLRNSNDPQGGKIYWMFFGNAGFLVTAGDKVTVVIGEFRAEDLVVE
jgi:hypothetical protein